MAGQIEPHDMASDAASNIEPGRAAVVPHPSTEKRDRVLHLGEELEQCRDIRRAGDS
jgi:hypothetical protein